MDVKTGLTGLTQSNSRAVADTIAGGDPEKKSRRPGWFVMRLNVAQKYILSSLLRTNLLVMSCFLALFWFFEVLDNVSHLGVANYNIGTLLGTTLLDLTGRFYVLLPIATLIGGLVTFANLSKSSELIVLRVSGVTNQTIVHWLFIFAVIFGGAGMIVGNWIAPIAQNLSVDITKKALNRVLRFDMKTGVWFKEQFVDPQLLLEGRLDTQVAQIRFVNVAGVDRDKSLKGIRIYEFNQQYQLLRFIQAPVAHFDHHFWRLEQANEIAFVFEPGTYKAPKQKTVKTYESLIWRTDLEQSLVLSGGYTIEDMSALSLWEQKKHLDDNGQDSTRHTLAFWKKIFYPLSVFVLLLWVLPFSVLAHSRQQNVAVRVFLGTVLGLLFFTLQSVVAYFFALMGWSLFLAVLLPNLFLLGFIGAAVLWIQRR